MRQVWAGPGATLGRVESERVTLVGSELFSAGEKRGAFIPATAATVERVIEATEALAATGTTVETIAEKSGEDAGSGIDVPENAPLSPPDVRY